MKAVLFASVLALSCFAFAQGKDETKSAASTRAQNSQELLKFNFRNVEAVDVIESFAKSTGERWIVDANVKGKITIFNSKPVSRDEAFSYLSTALATIQVAILDQVDGTKLVLPTRLALRASIPVLYEVPPEKPERLVTLIVTLKHASADEINKRLRILPSRDGELTPYEPTNQLLLTDWTGNIRRMAQMIESIDRPNQVQKK